MKNFLLLLVCLPLAAQITFTPPAMTFSSDAVQAMQAWIITQTAVTNTTLTGAITNSATSLPVASSTGFSVGDTVIVDTGGLSDAYNISAVPNGTTLTVTHNVQYGTTQRAHASASQVQLLAYSTFQVYCKKLVTADVQSHLSTSTASTTVNTAIAAIATQQAAIAAAVAAAVQ